MGYAFMYFSENRFDDSIEIFKGIVLDLDLSLSLFVIWTFVPRCCLREFYKAAPAGFQLILAAGEQFRPFSVHRFARASASLTESPSG
jgi:hypothetical protein